MLKTHGRYDYVPITARKDYTWPGGKRLAVYFCNNIEYFAFGDGPRLRLDRRQARTDAAQLRVARLRQPRRHLAHVRPLRRARLPARPQPELEILDHLPEIGERMMQRGDEFVAHGRSNSERQGDMWEQDEARLIAETTETIRKSRGKEARGWMSPWLSQSRQTLDLLQEAGYLYQCDWPLDDQPIWMRTRGREDPDMPYPVETNDSPMMLMRLHTAAELFDDLDRPVRRDARPVAQGPIAGLPVRAAHLHPGPAIPPAAAQACHAAYPAVIATRSG